MNIVCLHKSANLIRLLRSTYDRGGKLVLNSDDLRFILIDCEDGQLACASVQTHVWLVEK